MNFRKILTVFTVAAVGIVLSGCNTESDAVDTENYVGGDAPIQVVTTFSIITDMTKQVGKDLVDVYSLVPTGTDPHEYEPRPDDVKRANDADLLLYNGLNLEGGEGGWFTKLVNSVKAESDQVKQVSDGITPLYLHEEGGETPDNTNPHAFADPHNGIVMVENIRDALIAVDKEHEAEYRENADEYIAQLTEKLGEYSEKLADIPEDRRFLVTSERAFQYLAQSFNLKEGYLWAIDTDENGTPQQVTELITFIRENNVPALFVESNVDSRPMETVSQETGVPIVGILYSDEIGEPGSSVDHYLKYLSHNLDTIYDALHG